MRDRLIELISKFKRVCNQSCDGLAKSCTRCMEEQLADYVLADGWMRPPCKVGDTVYETQPIRKRTQAYEVTTVKYNGHYWWFTWAVKDSKGIYGNVEGFSSHQIGKTVFLTKEEAEAALKERERV